MLIRKGGLGKSLAGTLLALVWISAVLGCSKGSEPSSPPAAAVASATPATPQATPLNKPAAPVDKRLAIVIARSQFGDLTLKTIQEYAMTGLCSPLNIERPTTNTMIRMAPGQLGEAARWIGSRLAAEAEVKAKNDPALNTYLETGLQPNLDNVLVGHMLKNEIIDQTTSPTQAELASYYERVKPEFFQPYSFTIRMLMLQTYDPYVVQVGDTLEGIAQQVSGDVKAVANIRADVPGRPLRREPGKLFKPLVPGEKLWVPMSKTRMDEVRGRLDAILKDVKRTTDTHEQQLKFIVNAKKYDQSGLKGEVTTTLPSGTKQNKPPLTEISKAVNETPVGQISKVFQTKHGFQALMVMDKVESHSLPLSHPEVYKMVLEKISKDKIVKSTENVMGTLLDNPKLKIDYPLIAKGNTLTSDTVVAVLGDDKLLWKDLKETWTRAGSPREEARIRKMLYKNQGISVILFRDYLRPLANDPASGLHHQLTVMRTAYIGSAYISKLAAEEAIKRITPERIKDYYEKNKDKLFKASAQVAFDAAIWPLPQGQSQLKDQALDQALAELLKQYQAELQKVKTLNDYDSLRARLNEKMTNQGQSPISARELVPVSSLPADFQGAVRALQPGQWSAPFILGDKSGVATLVVRKTHSAGYESMEEADARIKEALLSQEVPALLKRFDNEFAQRAGVEIVYKPAAAPAGANAPAKAADKTSQSAPVSGASSPSGMKK